MNCLRGLKHSNLTSNPTLNIKPFIQNLILPCGDTNRNQNKAFKINIAQDTLDGLSSKTPAGLTK
jgi:hypothetical protein